MSKFNLRRGFTLVELMVVIIIIGILATLALPKFNQIRDSAKTTQTANNVANIQKALAQYSVDNNGLYPFKVRFYDEATVSDPRFDAYDIANFPPTIHTEPGRPWFAMGLFGGVEVVTSDWSDNTIQLDWGNTTEGGKPKLIQPAQWDYNSWFRYFNQYSDPLVAGGYIDGYPENPFLRRPMGSIMYGYGQTGWDGNGPQVWDKTIPHPQVVPTPGDFVYTFFYRTQDGDVLTPQGVVPARKSYVMDNPNAPTGTYYVDMIDSYQLWGYENIPLNGAFYVAYPNNSLNLSNRERDARRDWDNNGTRDMYERGMAQYFKVTGSGSSQAQNQGGGQLEF